MYNQINTFLLLGAAINAFAAMIHIGCIIYGAAWYRFFGAGMRMVRLVNQKSLEPTIVTSIIAVILLVWSVYSLSGAGVLDPLPLLRGGLVLITAIYLLRAIAGIPLALLDRKRSKFFWLWSSLICFVSGFVHLIGLIQIWHGYYQRI